MMIERHYDDEALIALMESDRLRTDVHLPSCAPCSEKLESFQMIADALRDRDTWDTRETRSEPVPATIANLRSFADRMTSEDAQAEIILESLLAGAREEWMPRLREHPEWRTAGVVRKLSAAIDRAIDAMPSDAVEMTALSTEIADHLDPASHSSDTVVRLRGVAWRDRAFALFYTGEFAKASWAVDRADRELEKCLVDEYDRARVGIVKALVLRALERIDEGSRAAAESAAAFRQFADLRRMASSSMAHVGLLSSRGEYDSAVTILEALEKSIRATGDDDTYARVVANLAYCTWKAGNRTDALRHFELASKTFDLLGTRTEAARDRWSIAVILGEEGRLADSRRLLEQVIAELEGLSMFSEAGLASLDLSELLLIDGRFDEVHQLCTSAMRSFEDAGVAYTQRAVTALAYIREAAEQRVASQKMVRHVRDYIRRLPQEPNLLFAQPLA